ncbi:MAG: LysR family transcriptional regulator [Spirochaetales bacterium]|nr:LysR family transcriptional regulator [Spirochaetales bacterium]
MTLTQLRYLIAVEKYGSFISAAEHCFVTQPTLSLQIQKLEQEMGVELFDRKRNPVVVTRMGEKIIAQARQVLLEAARLEELYQSDRPPGGSLKLGIIPTVAPALLPHLVRSLSHLSPELEFRIFELPTSQIIHRLRGEDLDLGILATPLEEKDLTEFPLYYEPFVAYYPPGAVPQSPVALKDLNRKPGGDGLFELVLLGEEHCFRNQSLQLCKGRSPARIECGSLDTLRKMVDEGAGMTLLPLLACDPQDPRVVPFAPPIPGREISLVHGPGFVKGRLIDLLKELILGPVPPGLRVRGDLDIVGLKNGG